MRWTRAGLFVASLCLCRASVARADPSLPVPTVKAAKPSPTATVTASPDRTKTAAVSGEMSVADLTAEVRDSTVVISVMGRDGERSSLGAGFAITRDGLIATNLHVIGEARPIVVTTSDGRRFEVTAIHATDQTMDLAIIRVDAKDLKPLELGDSDSIKQGQEVVAIGNPRGFEHSVVSGVVSGIRSIDGKPMIQLAMPIEQGNSGGPVLDRRGRVQGLVTMKSVVSENLGFAVAVNALKPLLKKPNPVPMDRWLTIGALDESEWTPLFGGRWRQRAGRVSVEAPGGAFGGRTLLVSKHAVPQLPFEMAAWVRLQREDGAAGLAFHFHDKDCHYGFYPSNGRIRLTRFDGPDVYSWQVLNEVQTSAYRPGEWNRLKIRVEAGKILGYVNDVLAVESTDTQYQQGQAGLASFRGTHAEFKGFGVGKDVPSVLPSRELTERVERLAGHLKLDAPPDPKVVASFLSDADAGVRALRQEADRREREAKQLRRLAEVLQLTRVEKELSSLFAQKDEKPIDLLRAALLVARIDNDDLDVDAYVREVDRLAAAVRAVLPPRANAAVRLKALDEHLFKKLGFHGSRTDFYNRSNSFLNEVIDDREGIPITLAVLYIELARRLEVNVVGIGLPGRFLVRAEADQDDVPLIDVFDGARRLSRAEVETQITVYTGRPSTPDDWRVQTKKQIVQRLVQNLVNTAEETNDAEGMLRYIDVLLTLDPASLADHWRRALLCYQTGRQSEALIEVNHLLGQDPGKLPATADPSQIRQLKKLLETHP